MDSYKNERLSVMLELIEEHWPIITDPTKDINLRVSKLDDLIHTTALFSGRMKQDKTFARIMFDWNLIHAGWTNVQYMYDVEHLMASGSKAPGKEERILLNDGIVLLIEDDIEDSLSVLSPEDRRMRRTLYANRHVMPYGRFAFQYGVSDDRDVSPQYVVWLQSPQQGEVSNAPQERDSSSKTLTEVAKEQREKRAQQAITP